MQKRKSRRRGKNPPNPKQRYGDAKLPLHLVPPAAAAAIARGLGEGAPKYGAWNWRQSPVELMTYVGAMRRHLDAWIDGEDLDAESQTGKSHLDGVIASAAIMLDAIACGSAIDNRPPRTNAAGILPRMAL